MENSFQRSAGAKASAFGTEYTILIPPALTEGRQSVYTSICPPDAGPPRHVHANEDETFYVVSGTVEFWLEGESQTASSGEAVFIPRGREHTFHVRSPEPANLLTVLTPGGFEEFFFAMERQGLSIPGDMPRIAQLAEQFGLRFTGPPLYPAGGEKPA